MIPILLFIVGAALGSFALVLAWRMHDKRDWVKGRSACDHCGHELAAKDLVPIASLLLLKGRCRYCKKRIPKTLLYAELLNGTFFAISYVFWPFELVSTTEIMLFVVWLLSLTVMSALYWYDIRWFILPTKLVYTLLLLAIVFMLLAMRSADASFSFLLSSILSAVALSGFFWLLHTMSSGKWIGYGDVRLGLPLGLFAGSVVMSWLLLFVASVIGLLFALPSLLKSKSKMTSKIPFGPMLILATVFIVLLGQSAIDSYLSFSGL